ncbi:cache domain-containing protein [Paenibacillus spongiae]|uniref:Cache domain-containing protein n=1 Tax=Paenibacillus spongiae TaxID=2909671 RepID=A0ABY5S762_9BACL|nr:cache domain-containing protein [Paenibacillus spongiae]UVI29747.1 cache domain-containing protein [Paenibacillus spongiae]
MFALLSRRIIVTLMTTAIIGVTIVGAVSYYFSAYLIRSEFSSIVSHFYDTSAGNLTRFLTYTEETVKVIANNATVMSAIRSPGYMTEVSEVLNGMVYNLNADIRGAAIYSLQGYTYTPTNYSDIPSLEQLRANPDFERFYTDPSSRGEWMYRDGADLSYYALRYAKDGILSYVMKIPENAEQPLAILVADIDGTKLAQYFQTTNALFRSAAIDIQRIERKPAHSGPVAAENDTSVVIRSLVHDSNIALTLSVPLANAKEPLQELRWTIGLLALLSAAAAAYAFRRLRSAIVRPLALLYKKMRRFSSSA